MLESFPICVLVGTILGFLSGLGVGGGTLLILWLNTVLSCEPTMARNINLLFFLPGALIATLLRGRKREIKPIKLFPAIIAGCIGAALFSHISERIDTDILRKLFGSLLIFTAIREFRTKKKKQEKP